MSISSISINVSESVTDSDSCVESSVYSTANSEFSRESDAEMFSPFDDSVEPLASPEEIRFYDFIMVTSIPNRAFQYLFTEI